MDRSDFLKLIGAGSVASVIPAGKKDEEKISTESGQDLEKLYQIMTEGKPFKIGGVEFIMTELNSEFCGDRFYGAWPSRLTASIVTSGRVR